MALDADNETFVVHVTIWKQEEMAMDPDKKAQIEAQIKAKSRAQSRAKSGVQVEALIFNKALTGVPAEYSDYSNVFLAENTVELLKNTGMNKYAIKLEEGKQPPLGLIYSLSLIELEMLKTYIKTNLANGLIRSSKSPARASILFDRKADGNLCLCVDYGGLNNIMIKNRYLLPLIGESFNRLGRAKQFTQLDLMNTYHRISIYKNDKWKTAIRIRYGYFKYQVMLFDLSNASATF